MQAVLQKYEHRASYIIIIPSPKQWTEIEACIKFIKHTMKKCTEANEDLHIALSHIRSTQLEPGLPCPATLLFNHPI